MERCLAAQMVKRKSAACGLSLQCFFALFPLRPSTSRYWRCLIMRSDSQLWCHFSGLGSVHLVVPCPSRECARTLILQQVKNGTTLSPK